MPLFLENGNQPIRALGVSLNVECVHHFLLEACGGRRLITYGDLALRVQITACNAEGGRG